MYRKKNRKAYLLVFGLVGLLFLLAVLLYFLNPARQSSGLEGVAKEGAGWILNGLFGSSKEKLSFEKELETARVEALTTEIEELKALLDLKKTHGQFTLTDATVILRNRATWNRSLTIDVGKREGMEEGMAVLAPTGLVGRIRTVYQTSSEVELLFGVGTTFQLSVSVIHDGKEVHGILERYRVEDETFLVVDLPKEHPIAEGDLVLTSGLGGSVPHGLFIGTVKKVTSDKYNISNTAEIESKTKDASLRYLSVVKGDAS